MSLFDRQRNEAREESEKTILNKESRGSLLQVVRTLSEQQKVIEKMADAGMDIYDNLPKGLQCSSRFDKLDCSNWTLKEASLDIESAIESIKSVID